MRENGYVEAVVGSVRCVLKTGFQAWVLGAFDLLLFESESQIERVRAVLPRGARVGAAIAREWLSRS